MILKPFAFAMLSFVVVVLFQGYFSRAHRKRFLREARRFRTLLWGQKKESFRRLPLWGAVLTAGVLVLSYVAWGSPVLRLLCLFSVPFLLPLATRHFWMERQRKLDASAIPFFHALWGLTKVGVSFPAALFSLSQSINSAFPESLRFFLARFKKGVPLPVCLNQFRERSGVQRAALCLALLETAYARGLPILPLLDRLLPMLEAEEQATLKIRSVQASLFFQVGLAALLPWTLGFFLFFMEPELISGFLQSGAAVPVILGSLLWELGGVFVLWKIARIR